MLEFNILFNYFNITLIDLQRDDAPFLGGTKYVICQIYQFSKVMGRWIFFWKFEFNM